jgi:hypothetical protein
VLTSNTSSRDSSNNSPTGSTHPNALSQVIKSTFDDGCLPLEDSPSLFEMVRAAAYSTTSRGNATTDAVDPEAPIRVSPKPPKGKKRKNVFIDDRGFSDQSDEFDTLLHSLDGGPMLRKRRHPAPAFDDIDPAFNFAFDEALHGAQFKEEFTPSPLLSDAENSWKSSSRNIGVCLTIEGCLCP